MKPIKMIYKPSESTEGVSVDVYSIHCTHDLEGNPACSFATGWLTKSEGWVTAPLWCFTPVKKKEQLKS